MVALSLPFFVHFCFNLAIRVLIQSISVLKHRQYQIKAWHRIVNVVIKCNLLNVLNIIIALIWLLSLFILYPQHPLNIQIGLWEHKCNIYLIESSYFILRIIIFISAYEYSVRFLICFSCVRIRLKQENGLVTFYFCFLTQANKHNILITVICLPVTDSLMLERL